MHTESLCCIAETNTMLINLFQDKMKVGSQKDNKKGD